MLCCPLTIKAAVQMQAVYHLPSVKRTFSLLKQMKSYARNMTGKKRLGALASMAIEKDLLMKMKHRDQLYDMSHRKVTLNCICMLHVNILSNLHCLHQPQARFKRQCWHQSAFRSFISSQPIAARNRDQMLFTLFTFFQILLLVRAQCTFNTPS